ncbi:peroxiredoxin family protein [Methylolobus aquaticus]
MMMSVNCALRRGRFASYLLLAIALSACQPNTGLRIGGQFPPIKLADVNGKPMNLPSDVKDKVALIRFWSITCPSCSKELLKALEELYQKYRDRGLVVVTINVDSTAESDAEFRKLKTITYPFLTDPAWGTAKALGIDKVPLTFIVDTQGIIREIIRGDAPPEFFEQLVTQVLYKGGFYGHQVRGP